VVVKKNFEAVDRTLENLQRVDYPDAGSSAVAVIEFLRFAPRLQMHRLSFIVVAGRSLVG